MKKITFITLTVIFTLGVFASTPLDPSDKILNSFHQDFPNIQQQLIYNCGDCYMVCFKENEHSSCKAFYNLNGVLLYTIKYYDASKLDPFIRSTINKRYHGKDISGITEVTSPDTHFYEVILQDSKAWYTVKYDATGIIFLKSKWNKA
jgi:hypothetical protein